jgi:hypothetical protein
MAGRGKFLAIGLALGLAVGGATTASLAGNGARSARSASLSFNFAQLVHGRMRGLVVARQKNSNVGIRVFISLHGMTPNRRYRLGASDTACSRLLDAAGPMLWHEDFKIRDTDEIYTSGIVRRHGQLTSARSVRLFDLDNVGGPSPIGCWEAVGPQALD